MRTLPSLPWIVRCSVQLYRWLLCLGPYIYRRQYGDLTPQLFRACCQDAYRQRGALGVLGLWLPLFSDVVAQMLAEHLSGLRRASELDVSVETASPNPGEQILCIKEQFHPWLFATTLADLTHLGPALTASSTDPKRDTSLISYRVFDGPDGAICWTNSRLD